MTMRIATTSPFAGLEQVLQGEPAFVEREIASGSRGDAEERVLGSAGNVILNLRDE